MKNDHTKTSFYLDLNHVHKYGSAKFQPNPLFCSKQMATEKVSKPIGDISHPNKVRKPIGDPVEGWDAPIILWDFLYGFQHKKFLLPLVMVTLP